MANISNQREHPGGQGCCRSTLQHSVFCPFVLLSQNAGGWALSKAKGFIWLRILVIAKSKQHVINIL